MGLYIIGIMFKSYGNIHFVPFHVTRRVYLGEKDEINDERRIYIENKCGQGFGEGY